MYHDEQGALDGLFGRLPGKSCSGMKKNTAAPCGNQHYKTKDFWPQWAPSGLQSCKYDIHGYVRMYSRRKQEKYRISVQRMRMDWKTWINAQNLENFLVIYLKQTANLSQYHNAKRHRAYIQTNYFIPNTRV